MNSTKSITVAHRREANTRAIHCAAANRLNKTVLLFVNKKLIFKKFTSFDDAESQESARSPIQQKSLDVHHLQLAVRLAHRLSRSVVNRDPVMEDQLLSEKKSSSLQMHLPDLVLIEVFGHLGMRSIFQVRFVNRSKF